MVLSGQMRVDMGVPGMLRGITGRSRVNMGTQHGQRRRRGSCVMSRGHPGLFTRGNVSTIQADRDYLKK